MDKILDTKIKAVENRLINSCNNLSKTFSTKDRNEVIKATIELKTLKDLKNSI